MKTFFGFKVALVDLVGLKVTSKGGRLVGSGGLVVVEVVEK